MHKEQCRSRQLEKSAFVRKIEDPGKTGVVLANLAVEKVIFPTARRPLLVFRTTAIARPH
jgi:hypothetical protein